MRILAAADVHGNRGVYEWLLRTAKQERADALILAGDLLTMDDEPVLRREADWLLALLRQSGLPVLYLMGNDDLISLDYRDDQIRPLHGDRIECGGFPFVGYQYSLPFMGGIYEKPEEEIGNDLAAIEPLLNERTILVTHSPAHGVLDRTFGGEHVGSRSVAALLDRRPVLMHIHGHIHHSFGREGKHFNVACAAQRRAFVVDLPSLNHQILLG